MEGKDMERIDVIKLTKLLWTLNDSKQLSNYEQIERECLLNSLMQSLISIQEIKDYFSHIWNQSTCFSINEFIQFLHDKFGTIQRPKIVEKHVNNEVFSEIDRQFLSAFFLGFQNSNDKEVRYRINSGLIAGWKQIKELS